MTSTRFAATCALLLLCSISINCSCFDKSGKSDGRLIIREERETAHENNEIEKERADIENPSDSQTQKPGFFHSFDLLKTARGLFPSSENLKNICKKYLDSYNTVPTTGSPQESEETPVTTVVSTSDENETIAEDHVEEDEDDKGGKYYGTYGYGYYPGYHMGNNYGNNYGFSNGYIPNAGNPNPYGGMRPGGGNAYAHGFRPPSNMYPGYGMPPGMRPGYGMNQGYGMPPGMRPGYGMGPGMGPGTGPGMSPGVGSGMGHGYGMGPVPYRPPRPNMGQGYGMAPHPGSRPGPPMVRPGYGMAPVGGSHNNNYGNYRPINVQGQRPNFNYAEGDVVHNRPPGTEGNNGGNGTYPPGYLGNSCSAHESGSGANTYGSMYGHNLYANQNYPPYYGSAYGRPPSNSRSLRPLPTLAFNFCQYFIGKDSEQ